jgi:hypothetical protein
MSEKFPAKVFWGTREKMEKMVAWHEERGLTVDFNNPDVSLEKVMSFLPPSHRGQVTKWCDVFYFENKDDALMFKIVFGGL